MVSLTEQEQASIAFLSDVVAQLQEGQTLQHVGFSGVSMLPMLRQGKDYVDVTKPTQRLRKYDLPMYMGPKGKYVMHRVIAVNDAGYICMGDNTYRPERVKHDQVVAVVTAFYRGGKRIMVGDWRYQAYCRVWRWLFPVRKLAVQARRWLRKLLR